MGTRAAAPRLDRLEQLKGLLKSRDHSTVIWLAGELGVSCRTVHRDLIVLRDAGYPVEADRGRGGGVRLHPNWALGRMQFNPAEAVDLLLSIAIAEQLHAPILLGHLPALRRKIVGAFAETHQRSIRALRRRIFIGAPATASVAASRRQVPPRALTALSDAFLNATRVTIDYVDRSGAITAREIEPHFLYVSLPVWYVLAWDRLREAIRHFRIDRIRDAAPTGERFRVGDSRPYVEDIEMRMAEL